MASVKPPEERFHQNVIGLTDLIRDIVTSVYERGYDVVNPNLIGLVSGFLKGYDRVKLIRNFIEYSYKHWDEIRLKESDFFEKNAMSIFRDLPLNNIDAFKSLYSLREPNGDLVVCQEDQEAVWDFFHSLVKICIKYIHAGRGPGIMNDGHMKKPIYTTHFCDEVELEKHAKLWRVELEFS